jgi:hypothetical protein
VDQKELAMKHTFFCVLKTGGWKASKAKDEYRPKQVRWLRDQVARFYPHAHRFVCLSDAQIPGINVIPLEHGWPGWWSKMELFRPDLDYLQAFYLDLDTVIVQDITNIVKQNHKFSVLRNLSELAAVHRPSECKRIGSGVMAWRKGRVEHLYEQFKTDPDRYMAEYVTSRRWGDQGFIQDHAGPFDYFQDMFPKEIVSSKFGLANNNPKKHAKIVCFHGSPKPWEIKKAWIPKMED